MTNAPNKSVSDWDKRKTLIPQRMLLKLRTKDVVFILHSASTTNTHFRFTLRFMSRLTFGSIKNLY